VSPAHDQVGYQAAALLHQMMRRRRTPSTPRLVAPRGVVTRRSTDVLAIEDRPLALALRFIRERACDGVRVDEVARHAAMSRSVLQRRFRAELKRSVHEELLRVKMKRAQELLAGSDLPIDVVADRAGFNYQEYMGAVFKSRLGKTPAEWRNLARGR
jgi:LacI family transcriptional regulator